MKNYVKVISTILLVLVMTACSRPAPKLEGFYQSEMIGGNTIQISIYDDENKTILLKNIDNIAFSLDTKFNNV